MRTIELKHQVLLVLLVCGLSSALAAADTKKFREGGGTGYVNVTFDDTWIWTDPADDTTHGNDTYNGFKTGTDRVALVAIKDLFTQLPKTSGGNTISISSAKLHIWRYNQGSSSNVVSVYRLTKNWLPGSAGTNENDVSGNHADKSADTHWASGNFSSSDYDSSPTTTGPWGDNYNQELIYTVTNQVAEMYDVGVNYGLVVRANGTIYGRASENSTNKPYLEITYEYVSTGYTLTVNSGSGDGTYSQGTNVNISADAAPSGKTFDKWTGDTANIANVNASSTTLTMPAANQTITATYKNIYLLTVNSGSGDGSYASGTNVNISADAAASGKFFDKWVGNTSSISDVNDPTTTLTMPAATQTITATYTWVASGLVTRYTFDTDGRDTYGSNNGTLTDGAAVTNDGTRGKVLSLDGTNDYVDLPAGSMTAGRSEMTLSMWIYPDEWVGSNTIWDEYAQTSYWQFTLHEYALYTRDSSTGATGSRNNDLVMPTMSTGQWQNLAVVYSVSGGKKAIYVDGILRASTSTSIDALTSDRDAARIGYASDGAYYDGLMDDVRLYSRALNLTELALVAEKTLYTLTVNSGSGDGSYGQSQVIGIVADAAPSGKTFDKWTGNTSGIANVNASSTTLTMPAANQTITATYKDTAVYYTLTVNSGTGDGTYTSGTNVNIAADTAPSGKTFDKWTGNTSGIADVNDPTTTITMPAANVTITATYKNIYLLTVNSGTGDGSYAQGTVVNISADSPASGKTFDKWTGNTSNIANVNASSTTLTMPAATQTITATYKDVGSGPSISSTSGTWADGNSITISGSSFGSKSTAKPLVWATFGSDINPTSLGQRTSWDGVGNMSWSSEYGGCAKASDGSGSWTLLVNYNYWTSDGQKIYMYKKEKKNWIWENTTQNWKLWRMWASSYSYPNIYAGVTRVYTEGLGSESGFWTGNLESGTTDWVTLELIVQASTYGNKDGSLAVIYDCVEAGSGTIMTRDSTDPDYMTMNFVVHGVLANMGSWNPAWSDSNRMWADDVYVDTTWSRVMVGDASTWSGCTHREMQIPSAWSSSSITIAAHKGDFSSFSGKYLYVVDSSGNANANGYACQ